jgi:hypothetical protein
MKNEKLTILWLRISFLTGAIVDGLAGIQMLVIAVSGTKLGLSQFKTDVPYRFAMAFGAALMLGWTGVLIWAWQKPVERKGVLLIVIPVVLGLIGSEVGAVIFHFLSLREVAPIWILQLVLIALFSCSYWKARSIGLK